MPFTVLQCVNKDIIIIISNHSIIKGLMWLSLIVGISELFFFNNCDRVKKRLGNIFEGSLGCDVKFNLAITISISLSFQINSMIDFRCFLCKIALCILCIWISMENKL